MKVEKTERGFNFVDLKDKYQGNFAIVQSSGDMSDVWLQIFAMKEPAPNGYQGNKQGNLTYSILIDDKVWKEIKKARRLARRCK